MKPISKFRLSPEEEAWKKRQMENNPVIADKIARSQTDGNPCLITYGNGPKETRCNLCQHLVATNSPAGYRFLKCDLRPITSGSATDHRAGWPACSKYEPDKERILLSKVPSKYHDVVKWCAKHGVKTWEAYEKSGAHRPTSDKLTRYEKLMFDTALKKGFIK